MATTHNFKNVVKRYEKFRRELPKVIGNTAVNFAKDNFRKQGFQDGGVKRWKERQQRDTGRAILVKAGALKRSIRVTRTTRNRVWIGSDRPYAKIHNEGGRITSTARVRQHTRRTRAGRTSVGAHTRQMNTNIPQRQYIGASKELNRRIRKTIRNRLRTVLR